VSLSSRIARRIYWALPRTAQLRLRASFGTALFARNTRGLSPDSEAAAWATANRRAVSIVIPSYNDLPFLTKCLASLERTLGDAEAEIIVVDDYAEQENARRLQQLEGGRVRVILRAERGGFAKAVNTGIAAAKHDVILLNSDTETLPGWFEAIQFAARGLDPRIGIVSPMLVYPDGLIQYGGTYHSRRSAPQWFAHRHVGRRASDPIARVPGYLRAACGACMYITREVVDAIGGFDEHYWLGFEDVDYSMRAWEAGFRSWYEPRGTVVHHESATRGYSQGPRELSSMRHFWARWAPLLLTRATAEPPRVTVLSTPASASAWADHLEALTVALVAEGISAEHRRLVGTGIDEALVAELAAEPRVVIAADSGAATTAWLAGERGGVPVRMLSGFDSDAPHGANGLARFAAGCQPEFDYIAPNRWTADRLAAETAWETRAVIAPAFVPLSALETGDRALVITVNAPSTLRVAVDAVADSAGATTRHIDVADPSFADLAEIARLRPRVVIELGAHPHALLPLALASTGGAFVGHRGDPTGHELMDGYNALLVDDADGAVRALTSLMEEDVRWRELAANGIETAARLQRLGVERMRRALADITEAAF